MSSAETVSISQPSAQDVAGVMQLATGFVFTAAMHPIAKLNIAEMLAVGPLSVAELARRTGSNQDALYRVIWSETLGRHFLTC